MKHVGFALIMLSVIVLTTSIIIASGHKTNRQNEIEVALGVAVDNALENVMVEKSYAIENKDEFIADFLEDLLLQLDSDSTVKVTIKGADMDRGLLSVDIVQEFTYNNGKKGSVSCERTVIFERYVYATNTNTINVDKEKTYTVEFYVPDNNGNYTLYKSISAKENGTVLTPTNPKLNGLTFKGWSTNKNGSSTDVSNTTIKNNMQFYAIFK